MPSCHLQLRLEGEPQFLAFSLHSLLVRLVFFKDSFSQFLGEQLSLLGVSGHSPSCAALLKMFVDSLSICYSPKSLLPS